MFNKKVIYLSALFLCLQDTLSTDMNVDIGGSSPSKNKRRLLDESTEDVGAGLTEQSAQVLTNTILGKQQWGSAGQLVYFYYAHREGHPEIAMRGIIWNCVANSQDIGNIIPLPEIPVEVRTLVSRLSRLDDAPEIYSIGKLLQSIGKVLKTEELIEALTPLMTPQFEQFLKLFLNDYDRLLKGKRLAQQLSQDPVRAARGFQGFDEAE